MSQLGLVKEESYGNSDRGYETTVDLLNSSHPWSSEINLTTERDSLIPRNDSRSLISNFSCSVEENTINLQWRNITYTTKDGTTVLNDLNGTSNSGQLTAIMGPSGSGKTSLVNVLSGFVQKGVTGEILVNGTMREMNSFRKISCCILQDDHILPRFTVRELITIASKLKISSSVSEKERQKAVDDCICCLGLVNQQHQRANTLSGGQKKRLSVAQDIVNNPPVIFLDEPMSGLDSSSCVQFVQLLKVMVEAGKNILCTVHQPSSRVYETFDNLYMLSDGDCIYRGPAKDLVSYMANQGLQCPKYHSPTDFLTDIAIGLYGEWCWKLKNAVKAVDDKNINLFKIRSSDISKNEGRNCITSMLHSIRNTVKEISQASWQDIRDSRCATSNLNQFQVLLKRGFLNILRDPVNMKLKFYGSVGIGLLLGFLYYDTGNDGSRAFYTLGLLFTLMVLLVITAKVPTVLTFPLQRSIFEREHWNGWYSTKMYYLATITAEIPYQIICPIISCGLVYWLTGQPLEMSRFGLFLLSGILVSLIAESIGLMIGAVTSIQNGIYLAAMTSGAFLVLSGHILPVSKTPVFLRWLYYCSYCRYGLKTIYETLFRNREPYDCSKGFCFSKYPDYYIKSREMDGNLVTDYCTLLMIFVIVRILTYVLLQSRVTRVK